MTEQTAGGTEGLPLRERYGHVFDRLAKYSRAPAKIDESNVYEEANPDTREIIDALIKDNLLPGSRLEGREHFAELLKLVKSGKNAIILAEHYSNMDLPAMMYLLEHDEGGFGKELAGRIVAISGVKLNEDNPLVRAYSEAFTRIVIYPSRSLAKLTDPDEINRGKKINMAAMRALYSARQNGQIIMVFPSGTRFRDGKPETKRGVREIDSYLRLFDVMALVSINGSCLRIPPDNSEDMLDDRVFHDKMIVAASPVMDCKLFRASVLNALPPDAADPKQAAVDRIMELLEEQHDVYEKARNK
ncbi:MAG: 1-acyl-sn-glycerol-3-phosphate acyltransferase [Spirochaetaceae bacterium]|nr:1-acyl-sn-glycerol-3-phosphate acyltransferase [Spirochaetaceae bacterium]